MLECSLEYECEKTKTHAQTAADGPNWNMVMSSGYRLSKLIYEKFEWEVSRIPMTDAPSFVFNPSTI